MTVTEFDKPTQVIVLPNGTVQIGIFESVPDVEWPPQCVATFDLTPDEAHAFGSELLFAARRARR